MITRLKNKLIKPKTLDGILNTFTETIGHLNALEDRHRSQIDLHNEQIVRLTEHSNRLSNEANRAKAIARNIGELIS